MADYGVRLINKYDITVANESDLNLTLRSSGQITNAQFAGGTYDQRRVLNLSGFNCPIVFIKSSTPDQRVSVVPGNSWSAGSTSMSFQVMKWHNKNVGTLQYYIYDLWTPPERSDYGMQIFDERGKEGGGIIFDSGWHFMRLRAVKWMDPGYPNHSAQDPAGANYQTVMNLPPSGNYALAMPAPRSYVYATWGAFGVFLYECFHYNDSTGDVNISLVPFGDYLDMPPTTGWASADSRSQVMVLDTTGVPTNYNSIV